MAAKTRTSPSLLRLTIFDCSAGFESIKKLGDMERILGDHASQVIWQNSLRVINEILDD